MAEIKIGYRAVFFDGEEKKINFSVKETYDEAVKDIERENENIEKYGIDTFTHAQVEKVYYRH